MCQIIRGALYAPQNVLQLDEHVLVVGDVGAVVAQELGGVVREDHGRLEELGLVLLGSYSVIP